MELRPIPGSPVPPEALPPRPHVVASDRTPPEGDRVQPIVNQRPDAAGIFLVPSRHHHAMHRTSVVIGRDVSLRTVFRHDVSEAGAHHRAGNGGGDRPVNLDGVGRVI